MFERRGRSRAQDMEKRQGPARSRPESVAPQAKSVFIGQSIRIRGELTGNEDMTIEGKVEGDINLKDHNVTIGAQGNIDAEIHAKNITIMGKVTGNVHAESLVEIRKTGDLTGDITAPRVVIEDGARFRGSVDMGTGTAEPARGDAGAEKGGIAAGADDAAKTG